MAATGTEAFTRARDFLLAHRSDYATAYRDFRWPRLTRFNWALDYFDPMARGNQATALHIVGDDGSGCAAASRSCRSAPTRSPIGCAPRACSAATACC